MKLSIGDTVLKSVMVHTDSDDATLVASALQSGLSGYAGGQKVVGTGKAFAFAFYGRVFSNDVIPIPISDINTISIASDTNSIRMTDSIVNFREFDFSTAKSVAVVTVNSVDCDVTVQVSNNTVTFTCSQNVGLQIVLGKDDYT